MTDEPQYVGPYFAGYAKDWLTQRWRRQDLSLDVADWALERAEAWDLSLFHGEKLNERACLLIAERLEQGGKLSDVPKQLGIDDSVALRIILQEARERFDELCREYDVDEKP